MIGDFRGLAELYVQNTEEGIFEMFAMTARNIWFRRNEWVHDGRFTHPTELVLRTSRQLEDFKEANRRGDENSRESPVSSQVWEKPAEGFFKVNSDAAMDKEKGRMGLRVIIRDHLGNVRAARSITRTGYMEPTAAEALAMFYGANLCKELDLQNCVLEGDAQAVVLAVQIGISTGNRWGHLVEGIRSTLHHCLSWNVRHVRREGNAVAHGLAKATTHDVIDKTWMIPSRNVFVIL